MRPKLPRRRKPGLLSRKKEKYHRLNEEALVLDHRRKIKQPSTRVYEAQLTDSGDSGVGRNKKVYKQMQRDMMTLTTRNPANIFSLLHLRTTLGVKYGGIMGPLLSKEHLLNESAQ